MLSSESGAACSRKFHTLASCTDEDLASVARESGPYANDALEALLRRHERSIYGACMSYLRSPDLAAEASQEVLMRVNRSIGGFQGRSSFRTWLYRVIHNECYSVASHHARHRVCESLDETVHANYAMAEGDLAAGIELNNVVDVVLQRLTPRDREVIQLRFFHDLSINKIATRLDTSLSGAKMRLYRALAKFEKTYTNLGAGEHVRA